MRHLPMFTAFLGLVLIPAPAHAETLQEAVRTALTNHPSVEAALAAKDSSDETTNEARSGHFPEINANASGGRMFGNNSSSRGLTVDRGEAYSWLWEGSASITQPIFNGMETFNRVDAARARSTSQDYNVIDVRENLALRAAQSYINVLRANAAMTKVRAYYETIQDYMDRIELMVDEGVADESEAAQAKNISIMLEDTLVEFEGQLKAAYADYNEVVGVMPDSNMPRPVAKADMIPGDVEAALAQAKANHPLVLASFSKMQAAGYDVEAEKGTLYPDLDGEISYLKRDQVEELGGEAIDARALLKMSWKFATGGGDFARIRKSKADYSEMLANSREAIRQIERDIRVAYSELETSEKQLSLIKTREEVTRELYDAYKTQFEGSRVRLLQLMQAENQMFNTQLEAINSDYRHLLAQYGTLASVGRLQQSLEVQNAVYDAPREVYSEVPEMPERDVPVIAADEYPVKQTVSKAQLPGAEVEKSLDRVVESSYEPAAQQTQKTPVEAVVVEEAVVAPTYEEEVEFVPVSTTYDYAKSIERVYPDLTE